MVLRHNIFRSTTSGKELWLGSVDGSETSYADTDSVDPGTVYYYTVEQIKGNRLKGT